MSNKKTRKFEEFLYKGLQKSDLLFIYDLIKSSRPKKAMAINTDDNIISAFKSYVQDLGLKCQIEQIASLEVPLDKLEYKIDFLILNATCNMPLDLLSFIQLFPNLTADAVVILEDAVLKDSVSGVLFASSLLFQNIIADKFVYNQEFYPELKEHIKLCGHSHSAICPEYSDICSRSSLQFHIISAFKICKNTSKYMGDLFAVLMTKWLCMPEDSFFNAFETTLKKYYTTDCLQIYQQAKETSVRRFYPFLYIFDSLLMTFPYLLLYGKGERGHSFLKLAQKANIEVTGYVVSDGRSFDAYCEGLPVYSFSKIPLDKDKVLIFQTADSEVVETLLKQSNYHWFKLPEIFWQRLI